MIEKLPAALTCRIHCGYLPLHLEFMNQCRSSIISKSIELYPETLDNVTISIIVDKTNKNNFRARASALSIMFHCSSDESLYEKVTFAQNDIRKDPTNRRRILQLIPRHVFIPKHDADNRDLNWRPRSAMVMLLSRMKIQQPSKQQQQTAGFIIEDEH
jgi:hypothetical protein